MCLIILDGDPRVKTKGEKDRPDSRRGERKIGQTNNVEYSKYTVENDTVIMISLHVNWSNRHEHFLRMIL